MGYVYLAVAIALELAGTNMMKASDGFSRLPYAVGTIVLYGLCFWSLSLSLRTIDLSIAYATWSGAGIIAAALISWFLWGERPVPMQWVGIGCIVLGVIICNYYGGER